MSDSTVVATLDSEKALETVKQIDSYVSAVADRATLFQTQVAGVFDKTNMPVVNQIYKSTQVLSENMAKVKDAASNILAIMTKYAEEVDAISNDSEGFESLG